MIVPEPMREEERRLAEMRFAEQFLIWALRAWTHNSLRPSDKRVAIETGFKLAKIEPALASLTFFMRVLLSVATRPIEIRCIHCTSASADEELLLHAVGALQAGRYMGAHIVLHHYLPCAAVRMATPSLAAFAERLRQGVLLIEQNEFGRAHVNGLAMDAMLPSAAVH